ncbi:MAG: YraN family protein [Blastocatellia bacterium]|nr:YraN family protein [Blastocatellia bacterium]
MTFSHIALGKLGEELAVDYLKSLGYKIVALNFVARLGRNSSGQPLTGEIDIVAYHLQTLCFVEVKTRSSDLFAPPESAVDRFKKRQIARTAKRYRQLFGLNDQPYRFDVVAIVVHEGGRPEIRLEKDFFSDPLLRRKLF